MLDVIFELKIPFVRMPESSANSTDMTYRDDFRFSVMRRRLPSCLRRSSRKFTRVVMHTSRRGFRRRMCLDIRYGFLLYQFPSLMLFLLSEIQGMRMVHQPLWTQFN